MRKGIDIIKQVKEKLGKSADAGDYIDDFKKSDAPQFKGKGFLARCWRMNFCPSL